MHLIECMGKIGAVLKAGIVYQEVYRAVIIINPVMIAEIKDGIIDSAIG